MTTNNSWDRDIPINVATGGTAQSSYAKGDILYASATNTLSKLAIGNANDIIKVSTDVPAYAKGLSGDRILLSSQTASASANLSFTSLVDNATYRFYEFHIIALQPETDTANLDMLWSTDNGVSYLSSAYKWTRGYTTSSANAANSSTSDSSIELAASCGTGTGEGVSGSIFYYPSSAPSTSYQNSHSTLCNFNSSGVLYRYDGVGLNTTTSEVDAFRFQFTSGNIQAGIINMYGTLL